MNSSRRKAVSVIVAAAVLAGVALPFAAPGRVLANWAKPAGQEYSQENSAVADQNTDIATGALAAEPVSAGNEAEITDQDGKPMRVVIADAGQEADKVREIDTDEAKVLQQAANSGSKPWLLDPVEVVRSQAAEYGFSPHKDSYSLVSRVYHGKKWNTGEARVLVRHGDRYYLLELIQPAGPGARNIWLIKSVREVRVSVRIPRPDIVPGLDGLDYGKVIKWQQNVDEGRELWRLDPLQVAKQEGKAYGFSGQDTFTVVRRLASSPLSRHGQVDVLVNHEGRKFTMTIVRPFGGKDAIWTTLRVSRMSDNRPAPPVNKRVLYQTEKYSGWDWYKPAYPGDMAMAVIADYAAQVKHDSRIPEFVLKTAQKVDYRKQVVLFAYLGTGGGADAIGIEKVTLSGNELVVAVRTRSVRPGQMETKNLTHPSDFVAIDRNAVDVWGGVNVRFVDQDGKTLGKSRLVISHRLDG